MSILLLEQIKRQGKKNMAFAPSAWKLAETANSSFNRRTTFPDHFTDFVRSTSLANSAPVVEKLIAFFDSDHPSRMILGVGKFGIVWEAGTNPLDLDDTTSGTSAFKFIVNINEVETETFAKQDETDALVGTWLTPGTWANGYQGTRVPAERTGTYFSSPEKAKDTLLNVADYTGAWHLSWAQTSRLVEAIGRALAAGKLHGHDAEGLVKSLERMLLMSREAIEVAVEEAVEVGEGKPDVDYLSSHIGSTVAQIERAYGSLQSVFKVEDIGLDDVLKLAISAVLQIGLTLRELFIDVGGSHGDLGLRNILFSMFSPAEGSELVYNEPGKTVGKKCRVTAQVRDKLFVFFLSDFGTFGLDNREALTTVGYQTRGQFFYVSDAYQGRVMSHGADLNILGAELVLFLSAKISAMTEDKSTGPISPATKKDLAAFMDFCVKDLLYPAESFFNGLFPFGGEINIRDKPGVDTRIDIKRVRALIYSKILAEPDPVEKANLLLSKLKDVMTASQLSRFVGGGAREAVVAAFLTIVPFGSVASPSAAVFNEFWKREIFASCWSGGKIKRAEEGEPERKVKRSAPFVSLMSMTSRAPPTDLRTKETLSPLTDL
jgi:hypothetical protein